MASLSNLPGTPSPLGLPDPAGKSKKKKIDIPYNRWPNRLRRALFSFIKIFLLVSVIWTIVAFARNGDVESALVFNGLGSLLSFGLQMIMMIFPLLMTYGALLWFLGRPKLEIIRPGDDTSVTFDDYWGQPQLVRLVKQWMSLLRDRKEFEKMGGKYISGLLLYGPPGTGKTMLAKAIAGESGMAFVAAEGTGFQGTFVGTDVIKVLQFAGKARQLARKYGACVAYIDEIDAIGANRGGVRGDQQLGMNAGRGGMMGMGMFGLSTLLSQMDGMNNLSRGEKATRGFFKLFGRQYKPKRNWHVMWMGSTNRPETLDPALTRSGRLDTKIAVEAPDRASRRLIIQGYLSRINTDDSIDVEAIVADTSGLTPADISAAITKDSVRIAFFDGRKKVSQRDIDRAFMEQQDGMEMPVEEFDENQRRVLAYHEAGHAVAMYYMAPESKIIRATINPLSTGVKGYVQEVDTVEQHIEPVNKLAYQIIISFAGRASEKIFSGEIFQSVGGDYPAVRTMMWLLIENGFFGPPLSNGSGGPRGSSYDQYLNDNDKTIRRYWLMMEDATDRLMRKHWRQVVAVAEELMVKKTLTGREVIEAIEGNQTAESLNDDIIPKTLAAIRAQALADIRSSGPQGNLLSPRAGGYAGGAPGVPDDAGRQNGQDESVTVINGTGNGEPVAIRHAQNVSSESGPVLLNNGGGFDPKPLNSETISDPPKAD